MSLVQAAIVVADGCGDKVEYYTCPLSASFGFCRFEPLTIATRNDESRNHSRENRHIAITTIQVQE
jgi:hypothetical protein